MSKEEFAQEITAHANEIRDFAEELCSFAESLQRSASQADACISVGVTAKALFEQFPAKKEHVATVRKLLKARLSERLKDL